jgi:predicted porin
VRRVGQLTFTFLLATCATVTLSVAARAQQLGQQPGFPGQGQTIQSPQQSPVEPPFSPLFGPYTPPPTEGPMDQPATPPPFMRKGGKALAPAAQAERLVVTPSILIDEAYTDNVFLDNNFKRSDFITSFTPGLLLGFRTPDFGLGVGYVFTSEIYAKETELTDALARWGASVAAFYNLTPQLRLDFEAGYFEDDNTTGSGIAGVSTGRTKSRGAAASPMLTWQFDPLTTIQLRAAWYTQKFDQDQFTNVALSKYDTYTISPTISRKITPSLTGTFQYQYLFSNVANGQDTEYNLILPGIYYQIAPDLSVTLSVGPQIVTKGQTGTTAAAQFSLTKGFTWGSIGLNASRSQTPTGGVGGSAETINAGLSATITNLVLPGLTLGLSPSYTNSAGSGTLGTTSSINLQVLATYPVTRWMAAFLAYNYFRQRTNGTDLNDVDANRVTAGIQLFEAVRLR